jgi:hypothetical protein
MILIFKMTYLQINAIHKCYQKKLCIIYFTILRFFDYTQLYCCIKTTRRQIFIIFVHLIWQKVKISLQMEWNPVKSANTFWRDGRVVECGGLENRCPPSGGPGVRIPLSPQDKLLPWQRRGIFIL